MLFGRGGGVVRSPPDGSCFFHSISNGNGHEFRSRYAAALHRNRRYVVELLKHLGGHDLVLENGLDAYIANVRHGMWGGYVDMYLICNLFKYEIVLHHRNERNEIVATDRFVPQTGAPIRTCDVLFHNQHYDRLTA